MLRVSVLFTVCLQESLLSEAELIVEEGKKPQNQKLDQEASVLVYNMVSSLQKLVFCKIDGL